MRHKAKQVVATIALAAGILFTGSPAQASTFAVTYSNTGNLDAAPVLIGTTLTLDALATGSFLSPNASLNLLWNPVSFHTHDFLDVTTGMDTGTFVITFATGETLFGNLSELDSNELLTTNMGAFQQSLVFTGGTGEFAGASGSTSGGGVVGANGFTTTGSGTLNAPGIATTPEPSAFALLGTGLLGVVGAVRRKQSR